MARDVELDSGNVTRCGVGIDDLHQAAELVSRKAAERDDPVDLAGAREILAQVRLDTDVGPAERVQPATVDFAKCLRVSFE